MNYKIKNISMRAFLYIFLFISLIVIMFPIYLMVISAFKKNNNELFLNPYLPAKRPSIDNFIEILNMKNIGTYFINSLIITIVTILLILIISSMVGYVLAKYKFFGKKFLIYYFLFGIMIPLRLGTITILRIFDKLHLFDNILSLIIVYVAAYLPISVFIVTGFIRLIPDELSNAARIDGCNNFGIFKNIIIPLIRPALAAVAIVNVLPVWNDFWFPLVLIESDKNKTVQLAVASLFGQFATNWTLVFAILNIAIIPVIILYLLISKQFLRGLAEGSFKG